MSTAAVCLHEIALTLEWILDSIGILDMIFLIVYSIDSIRSYSKDLCKKGVVLILVAADFGSDWISAR